MVREIYLSLNGGAARLLPLGASSYDRELAGKHQPGRRWNCRRSQRTGGLCRGSTLTGVDGRGGGPGQRKMVDYFPRSEVAKGVLGRTDGVRAVNGLV